MILRKTVILTWPVKTVLCCICGDESGVVDVCSPWYHLWHASILLNQ